MGIRTGWKLSVACLAGSLLAGCTPLQTNQQGIQGLTPPNLTAPRAQSPQNSTLFGNLWGQKQQPQQAQQAAFPTVNNPQQFGSNTQIPGGFGAMRTPDAPMPVIPAGGSHSPSNMNSFQHPGAPSIPNNSNPGFGSQRLTTPTGNYNLPPIQ